MSKNPVVYLFFNRPDHVKHSFRAIAKYQPKKLYLICDGPREHVAGESELVDECRGMVGRMTDWDCKIEKIYSDVNMGCGGRICTALDHVFSKEERAIILEDDCVANESFFNFMNSSLEYYKDNECVMAASASPLLRRGYTKSQDPNKAVFTRYWSPWGWGTWARFWNDYDYSMEGLEVWMESESYKKIIPSSAERDRISSSMLRIREGSLDTWDYQLLYALWRQEGLVVEPVVPLIRNIGFDANATHTSARACPHSFRNPMKVIEIKLPDTIDERLIIERDSAVARWVQTGPTVVEKIHAVLRRYWWRINLFFRCH